MKINGPNQVGSVNQYKKSQESQYSALVDKRSKKKDQVEISSEAKELLSNQETSTVGSSPEKIADLKKCKERMYHST